MSYNLPVRTMEAETLSDMHTSKRTSKACDYCRSKKIKCDGQARCGNCVKHNMACTYNYVAKKRSSMKRRRKRKISSEEDESESDTRYEAAPKSHESSLEARLGQMEYMMNMIVNKLNDAPQQPIMRPGIGLPPAPPPPPPLMASHSLMPSQPTSRMTPPAGIQARQMPPVFPNCDEPLPPSTNVTSAMLPEANGYDGDAKASSSSDLSEDGSTNSTRKNPFFQKYHGQHTFVAFFSLAGLKWLDKRVNDPRITQPLRALLGRIVRLEHKVLTVWVDPINKSALSPLPPRDVINKLCDESSLPVTFARIMDLPSLSKLYTMYCDYRDGLIQEPNFTYSELLLMNVSLVMCCSVYLERSHLVKTEQLDLNPEDVKAYSKSLLANSVFYYHRVSIVFDGLVGIRGILLLVWYADNISLSQSAYLMATIAIRQAQDMGLFQADAYKRLPKAEREKRTFIWWVCYFTDKYICIRYGKPPVINDADVSAPPLPGFENIWVKPGQYFKKEDIQHIKSSLQKLLEDPERIGEVELFLNIQLSIIYSSAYSSLFSVNSRVGKSQADIYHTAVSLLESLENWRQSVPESFRPESKLSKKYMEYIQVCKDKPTRKSMYELFLYMRISFQYNHLHVMLISVLSRMKWSGSEIQPSLGAKLAAFEGEGMKSALATLEMSAAAQHISCHFIHYCVFYPFACFLGICAHTLENPRNPNVKRNVNCMIDAARSSFNVQHDSTQEKGWVIAALIRCVLHIVIEFVCKQNPGLKFDCDDLLEQVRTIANSVDANTKKTRQDNVMESVHSGLKNGAKKRREFTNPPVASLVAPPSLNYSGSGMDEVGMSPRQDKRPLPGFIPTLLSTVDDDPSQHSISSLLDLFSKNDELTTSNESSGDQNGDPSPNTENQTPVDGESLFQSMFNVPTFMMEEDPSHVNIIESPSSLF